MTIRLANRTDVPVILKFIKELATYEKMLDCVIADEELLNEWLFDKKVAEVLLAQENDAVIGFALFFHNFSTFVGRAGLYLEDLYILPEYRGKGYGKSMFNELCKLAVARKCGRLEWCCLDWNTPSIEFYKGLGATPMTGWTTYRLTEDKIALIANSTDK